MASRMIVSLVACAALMRTGLAGLPPDYPSVPMRGVDSEVGMPLYGIGTWLYNNSRAAAAVELAFSLGYRHVDTAFVYKNHQGVGEALQRTGLPREEYFVTSKIPGGLNAADTTKTLNQCLADLGLTYVDLMLIHMPSGFDGGSASPEDRREEWKALEAWAKTGKARAIGVSHYCRHHAEDLLSINSVPIAVNQVQYHVGMGSAGGLATDDKTFFDSHGILYQAFSELCGPCEGADHWELINGTRVTRIGAAHGKSGAQVAMRWLVQQGIPVIPKSDKLLHLKENMDLFDFTLSDAEMDELTAATSPGVAGSSPEDSGDCGIGSAKEEVLFL